MTYTYKEAWDKIRDRHCTHNHYCTDNCMQGEDCCEYALALGAIEKQIPKKPQKFSTTPYYRCPICGNAVMASPYCKWCGQAIDWGEELSGE